MIPWGEALPLIARLLAELRIGADAVALGPRTIESGALTRTAALTRLLYEEYFIKGIDEREPPRQPADAEAFVARLSAANAGTGPRGDGWRRAGEDTAGRTVVVKDDRRWSVPSACVFDRGGTVELRLTKDDAWTDPAYYVVYGDALEVGAPAQPRTRYYVHLDAAGAAPMVAAVTAALNRAAIPFALKCFRDPHDYYRRDGMVAYVDSRRAAAADALLAACTRQPGALVRDPPPPLTRRLGPGLASAPDPPGESYGRRCCGLLARALLDALEAGAPRATAVVTAAAALERELG
jgi:hypothetical protein